MKYRYWYEKFNKIIKEQKNKIPNFPQELYNKLALHYFDAGDEATYTLYHPSMLEKHSFSENKLISSGEIDLEIINSIVFGMVKLGKPYTDEECNDAWMINAIKGNQTKGSKYGIFMYEVALNHCKRIGVPLMPDRWTVSKDAKDVWNIYDSSKRPDIKSTPLDITKDDANKLKIKQRTPTTTKDDCTLHEPQRLSPEDKQGNKQSPLDKSYVSTGNSSSKEIESALKRSQLVEKYLIQKYRLNKGRFNFHMMELGVEFF